MHAHFCVHRTQCEYSSDSHRYKPNCAYLGFALLQLCSEFGKLGFQLPQVVLGGLILLSSTHFELDLSNSAVYS